MTNPPYPPQWPNWRDPSDGMELREIGKTVARIETRMSEQHLVTVERLSSASRRMDGMDARMDRHERHTKQEISSLDRKLDSRLSQSERTLQRLIAAVLLMVSLALQPILGNWADTIKPLLSIFSSGK